MFDQNGLSLDQAPPIGVVLKLFLMGAIFGLLSGIAVLYYGDDVLDPSSTGALVFVHIMTLGVMLSFMLGALFQMLPVIAGVVLQKPTSKAYIIQGLVAIGTILLLFAFVSHESWAYLLATLLLLGAIFYAVITMIPRLYKISNHSASSRGMMMALASLFFVVVFASGLTMTLSGVWSGLGSLYVDYREAHYSFGLFGWIAVLIASISFQTIEMFYVTPAYPKSMSRYLPSFIFLSLMVGGLFGMLHLTVAWMGIRFLLALLLIVYAGFTIYRISQRKRPLADATVWFWRFGMASLIASMSLLIVNSFMQIESISQIMMIFYVSFVLSVLFAMFYKIVPFLTWFHLNSQGYFTAPMMHEVIHPKTAKKHLWIHVATVSSFIAGVFFSEILILSGLLSILSFAWIGYQILHAQKLYNFTQKNGDKFEFDMK